MTVLGAIAVFIFGAFLGYLLGSTRDLSDNGF